MLTYCCNISQYTQLNYYSRSRIITKMPKARVRSTWIFCIRLRPLIVCQFTPGWDNQCFQCRARSRQALDHQSFNPELHQTFTPDLIRHQHALGRSFHADTLVFYNFPGKLSKNISSSNNRCLLIHHFKLPVLYSRKISLLAHWLPLVAGELINYCLPYLISLISLVTSFQPHKQPCGISQCLTGSSDF